VVWSIVGGCVLLAIIALIIFWSVSSSQAKVPPRESGQGPAPPTVSAPTGFLRGSGMTTPDPVDLTAEGIIDWAHWGMENKDGFHHKRNVASQISTWKQIGTGRVANYKNNPVRYAWADGQPTLGVKYSQDGVYASGAGNGFELAIPADTVPRTLRVYVGVFKGTGKFEATLSDNAGPLYSNNFPTNRTAASNAVHILHFKALSPGQKLTIRYTLEEDFGGGNVTLQAATLAPAPAATPAAAAAPAASR
jgi:hypothetical protein